MDFFKKFTLFNVLLLLLFSCKKGQEVLPAPINHLSNIAATQINAALIVNPISNIKVSGRSYSSSSLSTGATYYTDRTYKITSIPSALAGSFFIKTSNEDKINTSASLYMSFSLSQNSTVYVAYDSRYTKLPLWLSTWKKLTSTINVDEPKLGGFVLFSKDFVKGTVTLGGNMASPAAGSSTNFLTIVKPGSSTGTTGESDPTPDNSFMLGINGHSMNVQSYTALSAVAQVNMLKRMGMTVFRQDMGFNSDGSVSSKTEFAEMYSATSVAGITILPMIYTKTLDLNKTESTNYNNAKIYGANIATKNAQYFKYYELGNELDNQCIISGDGDVNSDYNTKKFRVIAAYLKGLNDGIKSKQPGAQTMVDASWLHSAYLQMLSSYGVNYDIVAWHWYSDMENTATNRSVPIDITTRLSSLFNKPIWFTEAGQRYMSNTSAYERAQNDFTVNFINKCKKNSRVKALLFYELIDEPLKSPDEAHFGFVKWTTKYSIWQYKSVANTLASN